MIGISKDLDIAVQAVQKAGEVLRRHFGQKRHVIRKSPKEMVSEVDMQAQKEILQILEGYNPSYGILTEERRFQEPPSGKMWIIDPIDGTHNYIAGLPFSGVSIGLAEDNDFQLGAVYFPQEDELFCAVKGEGAFCNGEAIRVSENSDLSKAMICFDNQFHAHDRSFEYYRALTEKAFTTRILGVASRDLCLIASGRVDGRIWLNAKICDLAAGAVILQEAGGAITNTDGSALHLASREVVASNGKIHDQLLTIF